MLLLPNMFWLSRIGGGVEGEGRGEVEGEGGGGALTLLYDTSCAGNYCILLQVKLMDGYFKF